jgi:hypothetical protein
MVSPPFFNSFNKVRRLYAFFKFDQKNHLNMSGEFAGKEMINVVWLSMLSVIRRQKKASSPEILLNSSEEA